MASSTYASPPTSIRRTSSGRSTARTPRARWWSWSPRPSPPRRRWRTPSAPSAGARRSSSPSARTSRRRRPSALRRSCRCGTGSAAASRCGRRSGDGFAAACAMGFRNFEEFLAGGHEIDKHFADAPLEKNVPALMALFGVWNTNFLGATTHAVLPYGNKLRLLPAYLQQLEMESNGKRVDRAGRAVDYATAPVLWGAAGTVSQHSFHQLLHQGTQVVPCDFIDVAADEILSANVRAQADALAFGTYGTEVPPHKAYPGNRPSSILSLEQVTPRNVGRLIALYEHKVFTQGVIWNINSFDQWGVELGKQMANKILSGGK